MTLVVDAHAAEALRRAATAATLAPSVHNTQPWRFVLDDRGLDIYADWTRQLRVLDPRGRQLVISCGCAVLNARVALASAGHDAFVARFPEPARPDLLARIALGERVIKQRQLAVLDDEIASRHTNRRRFADEPVPDDVVEVLVRAANSESAELLPITGRKDRLATARLSQQADQVEKLDPAYEAELYAWTTDDPRRADGVQAMAVPRADGESRDDLPIRDFDTHGMGWLPVESGSNVGQCLLLLGTAADTPLAWLRAGEALERVLLELTRLGYAASPLTQVIEVAETNALLRQQLRLTMHPHVLLRVGRAPLTPASRRRTLADVVRDTS